MNFAASENFVINMLLFKYELRNIKKYLKEDNKNGYKNKTGYFGIRKQAKAYGSIVVCIPGYPAEYSRQMWKAKGSIIGSSQNLFSYKLSTSAGQSGSPIMRVYYGQWYALGVHTTGAENVNIGTRFGNYLYNFIKCYR